MVFKVGDVVMLDSDDENGNPRIAIVQRISEKGKVIVRFYSLPANEHIEDIPMDPEKLILMTYTKV